jgi:hypothetical protein
MRRFVDLLALLVISFVIVAPAFVPLAPSFPADLLNSSVSHFRVVSPAPIYLNAWGRRSAHFRMASSAGHRDCPHSVSRYSTLGGTCGYDFRRTIPSASIAFSCCPSIFCVMAGIARSSSENRRTFPPNRWKRITSFHLPVNAAPFPRQQRRLPAYSVWARQPS